MAIRDNTYLDKIMGGVQGDPNPFGYQNQVNNFVIDNEPFNEIPGFNFIDAPIETPFIQRAFKPEFRPFLNNPAVQNPFEKIGSGITSTIDKAKSGIGKGIDLGKTVGSGILSAIAGVPLLGNVLTGITSQFENRPLGAGVIDEFGNVYDPEELNKLNALGGYYTDPARSARRRSKRIAKMLERQKLGKKISLKNLAKLQAQEKAQREMQEKATKSMAAQNKAEGKGGYQSDFAQDSGFMGGSGTAADMASFKKGGLAGLKRKGFKGGGADMGAPERAQERADRGYGFTGGVDRPGNNNNTISNINKILKNVEFTETSGGITKPQLFFNSNLPFNIGDLKGKIFVDNILDNDDIKLDSQFSTNLLPGLNTTTKITEQGIGPTTLSYNDITALIDQNKNLQNVQYNKGPLSIGYGGDGNFYARLGISYKNGGLAGLL